MKPKKVATLAREPASHRPFEAIAKAARKKAKAAPERAAPERAAPERAAPVKTPPRPPAAPRDEDATFALAMAGVEALSGSKGTRIPKTLSRVERSPRRPAAQGDEVAEAELSALVVSGLRFEITDDGERLEGRRIELDPRVVRRLRHGRGVLDAKLDLHGKTSAEARRALETFVKDRRTRGDRLLLVVHGKGLHAVSSP